MTAAATAPDDERRVRTLRFRSLENRWRSEEALDRDDLVGFADRRHTAALERELADEIEGSR